MTWWPATQSVSSCDLRSVLASVSLPAFLGAADSDSASLGSNPSPPANLVNNLVASRNKQVAFGSNTGLTYENLAILAAT
jgi:hypothetical protein